ncbi:alpha/beta hydrolase [Thalassotalea sp. M1531]|uniref:Alpha/beta hydrolase n=1 Tax=Thalassotalea algicola TaxID=2716224 RepID=A0A7Y0Q698_9GAMM|nr:alpha/beta hydrolase [Thalassotalea algicola]NMP31158.1 alpha/beta hydrolase [Thalassotalea algicola]
MQHVTLSNGITINFQDEGKKSSPTIILIMGLGAHMAIWPDELYYGLVDKGFRVIRFDNRDAGRSSQLDDLNPPSIFKVWLSNQLPFKTNIPYKLDDMANDVLEIMAVLKIKRAHLVGASMGGMIAQILAAKYKKKVSSLTSIMSTTSMPKLSKSNLNIMLKLAHRPNQNTPNAAINYTIKLNRLIESPAFPNDEQRLRRLAKKSIERGYNPAGIKRQLVAITASGSRRALMRDIKAPTLVIHGTDDPVISVNAGIETAHQIKKAKLKIVEGLGHDFPPELMKKWVKWISKHVLKSEQKRAAQKLKKQVNGNLDTFMK